MGTEEKDLHDRLFVRDYKMWSTICSKRPHVDGKLSVQSINNGIVLPWKLGDDKVKKLGGVHDENFNFIIGSALKKERNFNRIDYGVINGGYSVPESALEYSSETVVYGGCIAPAAYESLFLFVAAFSWWQIKNPDPNIKIVFISAFGPFTNNQRLVNRIIEFEELLGVPKERLIFCDKPTKFKTVIAPEPSICAWKDYYDEYTLVFEKIRETVVPGNYKKVYLTRREYNKRQNVHDYINEEYFEDFYREKGFTIIAPEKHSLREQAAIMMGADEIVSVLGSPSNFSVMLSKPGTKLVYLNRIDVWDVSFENFPISHQMNNTDYYFIDVCYNFLNQSQDFGVYLLGPTSYWKKYVKTTYNENIDISYEEVLEKHAYQYLKNWLLYCSPPQLYWWLKNTDNFDILNNMCRVILGQELDKSKYDVGLTKLELNRKVNELNRKVSELSAALNKANTELSNDTRLAKLSAIERQIGTVADTVSKAQLSTIEREKLLEQNKGLSVRIETQNSYIDYANSSLEKMQENNQKLSELCQKLTDKKDELVKANESMAVETALKDRTIKELNTNLENAEKTISGLQVDLGNLQKDMTENIVLKDKAIEELRGDLANSEKTILGLKADISVLQKDTAEKTALKDKTIEELRAGLAKSEKTVSSLKADVSVLQNEKEDIIAQKENDIEKVRAELVASQKQISDLQNNVEALKVDIAKMENSHSWKITKPLRAIKRLFAKR